jgi:hypothetical protein
VSCPSRTDKEGVVGNSGRKHLAPPLACAIVVAALLGGTETAAAAPTIGGCQVFPAFAGSATAPSAPDQTAWNQDISQAPLNPRSNQIISRIQSDADNDFLHPDFGSNPGYGIPYKTVPSDQEKVPVEVGIYADESDFGINTDGPRRAPIAPNTPIEAGSDRHALVVQRGTCKLFEMGVAKYLGGPKHKWKAAGTALFDLDAAGPLRNGGDYITSADAAGLPILPGLVRVKEADAGHIDHAIRITFDETSRSYIYPATHYASDSCNLDRPAMGMRFRLKAGYFADHLDDYPAGSQSRAVFVALRHYGAINADNGTSWYITGQTSPDWHDNDLNRLKQVPGTAFEVVKSQADPRVASDC